MSNKVKTLLIRLAALVLLVAIAVAMYLLGRGHTVYIDNKKLEHDGTTYDTPYKVEVYVGGERVAKLYDKERGAATCIGANFAMELVIIQEKGGDETTASFAIKLPYDKDGLIVNIPGLLAGLPQEVYMTEFISTEEANPVEEEVSTDEFASDEFSMDGAEF